MNVAPGPALDLLFLNAKKEPLIQSTTDSDAPKEKISVQGIIEPSYISWASSVNLVSKKDGLKRFFVDYRKLNSVNNKNIYPLPRIADILYTLRDAQFFTMLDLAMATGRLNLTPLLMRILPLLHTEVCMNSTICLEAVAVPGFQ